MSKATKLLASLLALVALAAGGLLYKNHLENSPHLVGKCYVDKEQGIGLAIVDAPTMENEKGEEVQVYVGLVVLGPFQIPQPLDIKKANKDIPKMVKEGLLDEVNCATGEPISK